MPPLVADEEAIAMQHSLRIAVYARVSSEQQVGESTIASQLAALETRVLADRLKLPAEHRCVDDGYSGATLVRPGLERLRDLAAAGSLDRVYVHSPDRLARRYAYQVLLVDELRRAGIEIVFLNRAIGTSAETICCSRYRAWSRNTSGRSFWSAAAGASATPPAWGR